MAMFASGAKENTIPPATPPDWAQTEPVKALCALAPRWAEIKTKGMELARRAAEIHSEIGTLKEPLAKSGEFDSFRVANEMSTAALLAAQPPAKEIKASPGAAALLGALTPPPRAPAPYFKPRRSPDRERFDALGRELESIEEALALLNQVAPGERRSEVENLYLDGCREYCEIVRPEYDAITARFCNALVALGEATVAYNDFVKERLVGIAWASLRPIQTSQMLGDPLDQTSELRRLLTLAAERGHFNLADLPEDWKRKPGDASRSPRPQRKGAAK
jgi:hypothetical protein